ncbi:hypothetical protein D1872_52080 [compost metagenome]
MELEKYPSIIVNNDVVRSLPFPLDKEEGPWISGGSARRMMFRWSIDSDIDVFFKSWKQLEKWQKALREIEDKRRPPNFLRVDDEPKKGTNQITFYVPSASDPTREYKVQLICKDVYPSMEKLVDTFDFNVCQVVFDGSNFYYPKNSLPAISAGLIKVHRVTYPVSTFRRVQKYLSKGNFTIEGPEIVKLIQQLYDSLGSEDEEGLYREE